MEISKYLLLPFTLLYALGVKVRNTLYDKKWRGSVSFETNLIVVGNLEAGGTGKTPMITYIIGLLKDQYKLAILSRGYKRKTKGFLMADEESNADSLGDEPYLLYSRYKNEVNVAVGKERETAIPFILAEKPETDVILMDDGFQYRTVIPSMSILLTRYQRLFTKDWYLPSGRLRESRQGAERSDIIVVTKCPENLSQKEQQAIETEIKGYGNKPVFFTSIKYENPVPFKEGELYSQVVLVTGIAHYQPFREYLESRYDIIKHFDFPDHHSYSDSDIEAIREYCEGKQVTILTTEKDIVKWDVSMFDSPVYFIPISLQFLNNGTLFEELLTGSIKDYELPY